jgi:hypothetical protein
MLSREDIKDVLQLINEIETHIVKDKDINEALRDIGELQDFFEYELEGEK